MSSPKAPTPAQHVLLPTTNGDSIREVFVTELTGTQVIGGNLHMEFSVARPTFTSTAPGVATVTLTRAPGARLVLPLGAIPDVAEQLRQIIAGMQVHQAGMPTPKAN